MISLIINTYKDDAKLLAVLESLTQQSSKSFEICIAEDAEEQSTKKLISSFSSRLQIKVLHASQPDLGFRRSKILNRSIAQSSGDYIVFLDGDCIPHRHFIADHMALAEPDHFVQGRRAFIRESAVDDVLKNGLKLPSRIFKNQAYGLAKAFRWILPKIKINTDLHKTLGCNLGIWKKDLLAINGFDEAYEGWGREDSDLVARLYHLGLKRKLVHGRAIVYHLDHPINSKTSLDKNDARLQKVLENKSIRCSMGIELNQ